MEIWVLQVIRVSVHMHIKDNTPANTRLQAIYTGLRGRPGVVVNQMLRTQLDRSTDLVVVKGMSASLPLRFACDEGIPYIILEDPYWRPSKDFILLNTSWGYNGYAGYAWYPETPDEERPKPTLRPWKKEGSVIIFGQKPDDYSLRSHDHVQWLLDKQEQYPDAELRHHPLMMPNKEPTESLVSALDRCYHAVTFSSTVGTEALIAGCKSWPECEGSAAYRVYDRDEWLHRLSWRQFSNGELANTDAVKHILSGYDEARDRADRGLMERPREKLNRDINDARYRKEFMT